MSDLDLDALAALADAATDGPWEEDAHIGGEGSVVLGAGRWIAHVPANYPYARDDYDATFIAAARDAVPALIAEVRALRDTVESMEHEHDLTRARIREVREAVGVDYLSEIPAEVARLRAGIEELRLLVSTQAEDEGLWFLAETMPEAYLQQELRVLHAAVEAALLSPPTTTGQETPDV